MKIVIIGAGVAGCSIAAGLNQAGFDVHVVDQASGPALETSAHHAALAHPHLTRFPTPLQQLTKWANQYAFKTWESFRLHTGAFQVMTDENWISYDLMQERLKRLGLLNDAQIMDERQAKDFVGINRKGVWYPQAGVYDLVGIAKFGLRNIPKGNQHWNTHIEKIERCDHRWLLLNEHQQTVLDADILVLANGLSVAPLLDSIEVDIVLRSVRGQLSRFQIKPTSEWVEHLPTVALTGGGYSTPPIKNQECIEIQVGSSYDEDNWVREPWDESDTHNKNQLRDLIGIPTLALEDLRPLKPFVGLRCVAKDRMPFIGPIEGQPGLLIATALGARGVLWSSLAQALITEYVKNYFEEAFLRPGFLAEVSEEEVSSFAAAVAPERFLAGAPLVAGRASNSKPTLPSA